MQIRSWILKQVNKINCNQLVHRDLRLIKMLKLKRLDEIHVYEYTQKLNGKSKT